MVAGAEEAWAAGVETLAYRGRDPLVILTAELRRPSWMARAACRGMGPDLFFMSDRRDEALGVCDACPVPGDCRAWGAAEEFGVWAGEPRQAQRRAGPLVCSTPGCGLPARSRGLCSSCYMHAYRRLKAGSLLAAEAEEA